MYYKSYDDYKLANPYDECNVEPDLEDVDFNIYCRPDKIDLWKKAYRIDENHIYEIKGVDGVDEGYLNFILDFEIDNNSPYSATEQARCIVEKVDPTAIVRESNTNNVEVRIATTKEQLHIWRLFPFYIVSDIDYVEGPDPLPTMAIFDILVSIPDITMTDAQIADYVKQEVKRKDEMAIAKIMYYLF